MRTPALLVLSALFLAFTPGCTEETSETNPNPEPKDPAQLDAPPAGQGVQFETEEIEVPSGTEQQNCYFFKVSDLAKKGGLDPAKPINLHHIQIAQREGSHHMNLFRVKTVVGLDPTKGTVYGTNGEGECFKSPNWADWPLIANSQQEGNTDWTYPSGVANVFQPDEWIMLQTHYVNANTQKTEEPGKVRVNFWSIKSEEVTAELGTIFATKQSVRVCQSNPTPTYEGTCQINSPEPVHVIGANGHFHSRGKTFEIYSWDGTSATTPPASSRFYTSEAWDDPPMMHSPELDVTVPAGGGVWYTCAYQWQQPVPEVGCSGLDAFDAKKYSTPEDKLDCCYTFGPIVEKNEHCNAFIYYYPKRDDVNCF